MNSPEEWAEGVLRAQKEKRPYIATHERLMRSHQGGCLWECDEFNTPVRGPDRNFWTGDWGSKWFCSYWSNDSEKRYLEKPDDPFRQSPLREWNDRIIMGVKTPTEDFEGLGHFSTFIQLLPHRTEDELIEFLRWQLLTEHRGFPAAWPDAKRFWESDYLNYSKSCPIFSFFTPGGGFAGHMNGVDVAFRVNAAIVEIDGVSHAKPVEPPGYTRAVQLDERGEPGWQDARRHHQTARMDARRHH